MGFNNGWILSCYHLYGASNTGAVKITFPLAYTTGAPCIGTGWNGQYGIGTIKLNNCTRTGVQIYTNTLTTGTTTTVNNGESNIGMTLVCMGI